MEHNEKITIEKTEGIISQPKEAQYSPATAVAASIVVGAILISASIFYNTNLIVKNFSGQSFGSNQAPSVVAVGNGQQAAPSQPAQAGTVVNVASRNDAPTLGNKNAKVTVIEFGDFQCPFCKQFYQQTFSQIKSAYIDSGKIQYIFRHFPLTQLHVNAQISAEAAECANLQGKFWDYHNLLYTDGQADGTGLDKASLEKYADTLGLNNGTFGFGKNKFNQCLESNATLATVNADQAEGSKDGVSGTPSFFINGKIIVGAQPYATFQQAIDAALKQ